MAIEQLPAGWYEDPRTRARRYWDGARWADEALPEPVMPRPAFPQAPPTNGLAVAGFVLSLVGILLCGVGSVVGLVLSWAALEQIKKSGGAQGGRGLAIAGAVIGGVVTALLAAWVALIFAGLALGGGST